MPSLLPLSSAFHFDTLASRPAGRIQDGAFSWCVLPRLLLDLNGLIVCWRRNEPFMDSRNYGICSAGKGVAFWGRRWTSDGTVDDHCRWDNYVYENISCIGVPTHTC